MILPEIPISWRYLKHLLRIYGNSKHHDSQLSAVATLITRDVLLRLVLVPADTAVHKLNHCVSITCRSLIVLTDCRYCMETIFITITVLQCLTGCCTAFARMRKNAMHIKLCALFHLYHGKLGAYLFS